MVRGWMPSAWPAATLLGLATKRKRALRQSERAWAGRKGLRTADQ